MGRLHDICKFFHPSLPIFHPILSSWHVYITLQWHYQTYIMFCRNSLWRNLWTCPPTTSWKQCIMYGFNNLGKGEFVHTLHLQMNMFKHSCNQHCITISRKVVHQVRGLIGMNFSFGKQPNLVTWNNLQMQFWNMHRAHISQQESHIWKGKRFLALADKSLTCLKDQKGIHINMIVLIFFAHISTPRLENRTCNVSGLLLELIHMRAWIPLMAMPRSLKLLAKMQSAM